MYGSTLFYGYLVRLRGPNINYIGLIDRIASIDYIPMSTLLEGFTGWFRPKRNDPADEQTNSAATASTGGELDQEPVVVWMAANQMEAQVIKGRLESEGIPAIIRGEALGAIYGLTTGALAESAVLVPAALAEKAEALLQSDEDWEADETPPAAE